MPPLILNPFSSSHSLLPSLQSFLSSPLPPFSSPLSLSTWQAWYETQDPLHPAIWFATGLSVVVWLLGEVTGNVSQVDRLWTFLPVIYSLHFTFWPRITGAANGIISERQLLFLALRLLWSARLTTNTYRRGFFNPKSEDYRWDYVRERIPSWQFKLLNLIFIAFIQNFLLLLTELPQYLLLTHHLDPRSLSPALGLSDYLIASGFVFTLVVEMLADNEQQRFQGLKRRALEKGANERTIEENAVVERGFVTGGLWSWSRHPNFACEQLTWWILYLLTVLPFLPPTSYNLTTLTNTFKSLDVPYLPTTLSELQFFIPTLSSTELLAKKVWETVKAGEGKWWNYSIISPIGMSGLFYSSTDLTERISRGKYPHYRAYQQRVSEFWPVFTPLKGLWLFLTARKGKVERKVWGGMGEKKRQ